ncbi:MAG: penicillin-binding protein 2 [Rhodospirillaceae bacterium]|nr:penicillin-binding protein 2 [Rhodospirillaceae bacterium]
MNQHDLVRYKVFTRRSLLFGGLQLAMLSALGGRLYYLQVVQGDRYKMLAEENRINLRLLPPPRGRILDRNGVPVALNRQNYRVVLVSEQTPDVEHTLDALAQIVPIDADERKRIQRDIGRKRSFVPVTVCEHLDWNQVATIAVNSPELAGVSIDVGELRHYPYGPMLAHVIGYVAMVSEDELTGDPLLELPGFRIGKNGIEKTHDLELRGRAGNSYVEVNAHGRVIRELEREDGQPGSDVTLSIDLGLQQFVSDRLGTESAAAVVMDVTNGEILAIASTPSYDPNAFNQGLSRTQWQELVGNPRHPLINKAISGQYPPGSTFKLVVALAALESGVVTESHRVWCPGHMTLGNRRFHCWKRGGHGHLTMVEAIAQSCDVYFYDLSLKVGIDRIAAMANRLGLGSTLALDLPGEHAGLIPNRDWKMATRGRAWHKGETLNAGIGQGYVLATPLQLVTMTAQMVNGGRRIHPHLTIGIGQTAEEGLDPGNGLGLSSASLAVIRRGMDEVVNGRHGTAGGAKIEEPGMEMGGKTGTSQVRRISKSERDSGVIKNEDKPWEERDHALFVGFAPVDAPRYAVAIVVEHGGGGSKAAAPIARDVLIETQRRDPSRRAAPLAEAPERDSRSEG